MIVGIVIGRIGGMDGVALETEKWITVLRRMGHQPKVLTGELEAPLRDVSLLPPLAFSHPDCVWAQEEVFYGQGTSEDEVMDRLHREARILEAGIFEWLRAEQIDVLLTQNSTSLPCHLTMGMALCSVIESTGIPTISHNHDFHWERGDRYETGYQGVRDVIAQCFPPVLPNVRHVVINTYCRDEVRERYGIDATIVPNVMDFDGGFGEPNEFASRIPESLGLPADSLLLFQVTRVVPRKGIETAIELVERLEDPRVRLVVTGTATDDRNGEYANELRVLCRSLGVEEQVAFVGDRFGNVRRPGANGDTVFSLSDGYSVATACTYFSRYEGFGNAFVEAVAARRPIFVNDYQPVYWPDIGSNGFKTVQIQDGELTDTAVSAVAGLLSDPEQRREVAEFNYQLGRELFSLDVLEDHLGRLLD